HAGEGRELIDHAADVADLTDNRVGALVEDLLVVADLIAVLAFEPLCRKLDGGQWILDFVGNASGDVGPGGVSLSGDQVGNVVEGQDMAVAGGVRAFGGEAREETAVRPALIDVDLALGKT